MLYWNNPTLQIIRKNPLKRIYQLFLKLSSSTPVL